MGGTTKSYRRSTRCERKKKKRTLIPFQWKNRKSNLKHINENIEMNVHHHEGDIVNMKQIPATTAREMLGVRMQSPSGSEDEEEKYLHRKLKTRNQKIYTSALRRHDITKAVNMTIVRTI